MAWAPSFPEAFSFYGLGEVSRSAEAAPPPSALTEAIGFELLADDPRPGKAWILLAPRAERPSPNLELELANVLASRIAGAWISPPRALRAKALLRVLRAAAVTRSFVYVLNASPGPILVRGWILASLAGDSGHA